MEKKVIALIPAYNEEERIGLTIKSLFSITEINEVIVIDDGSNDDTGFIATSLGAKVISNNKNSGKGAALNKAIDHITGDIVVLVDADLGESAKEIKKLLEPILKGYADMTIAAFPKRKKKSGFGIVKGFARWTVKKYGGNYLEEPLSGQRALTRAAFHKITPFSDGYGVEVIANIKALKNGLRVIEIPTNMHHRVTGRDLKGFLHRGKQLRDIIFALYNMKI